MPKLKAARTSLLTVPRLRAARIGLTGPVVTVPRLRAARIGLTGPVAVIVTPPSALTAEPETLVTLTPTLAGGQVGDTWTVRVVSGPAPTSGPNLAAGVVTLRTPSIWPPNSQALVIGYRATKDGITSAEATTTITVLPQTDWSRVHGGTWVGATRT